MGANIRQCRQCGKLFQTFGSGICPGCAEELDRCFKVVKSYLYDHPDANVFETAQSTGVSEKIILDFLREDRLSIKAADGMLLCESCGMPISAGRYCGKCQNSLESALLSCCKPDPNKHEETRKISGSGRMHVNHQSL